MGRLIISNAITVNGAFEAPVHAPGGWLVLDPDSQQASLEMWQAADAMVMAARPMRASPRCGPAWPRPPGSRPSHTR